MTAFEGAVAHFLSAFVLHGVVMAATLGKGHGEVKFFLGLRLCQPRAVTVFQGLGYRQRAYLCLAVFNCQLDGFPPLLLCLCDGEGVADDRRILLISHKVVALRRRLLLKIIVPCRKGDGDFSVLVGHEVFKDRGTIGFIKAENGTG